MSVFIVFQVHSIPVLPHPPACPRTHNPDFSAWLSCLGIRNRFVPSINHEPTQSQPVPLTSSSTYFLSSLKILGRGTAWCTHQDVNKSPLLPTPRSPPHPPLRGGAARAGGLAHSGARASSEARERPVQLPCRGRLCRRSCWSRRWTVPVYFLVPHLTILVGSAMCEIGRDRLTTRLRAWVVFTVMCDCGVWLV